MSIPEGVLVAVQKAAKAVLAADSELSGLVIATANDPSLFPVALANEVGRIDLCAIAGKDSVEGHRGGGISTLTIHLTLLVRMKVDVLATVIDQDAISDDAKNLEEYVIGLLRGDNRGFAVAGHGKPVYAGREVQLEVGDLRRTKVATVLSLSAWTLHARTGR